MSQLQPVERLHVDYGADFGDRALQIAPGLGYDEWDDFGEKLVKLQTRTEWWTIDWLMYGLERFGEAAPSAKAFATAVDKDGTWQLSPKTIQNYITIGHKFPPQRRIVDLSPSHYSEVTMLDPDRQLDLLEHAERERMTVTDFRKYCRRFKKHIPRGPTDPTTVVDRLQDTIDENYTLYSALNQLIAEVEEKTGLNALAMLEEETPEWPALRAAAALVNDLPGYGEE